MKDKQLQNEEEQAPSVRKDAKQGAESQEPREWKWVEAGVWTERMLTALADGVKGGKWYSLMDKVYAGRTLEAAWVKVERNSGAAGIDRMSIEQFRSHQDRYLLELHENLQDGSFQPSAVRRVYIPKGKGEERPLGIPTVKDRVVQTALKMALEPIFEKEFLPMSYGFRPGRGCKDALREVDGLIKSGHTWVVDADLKSYFDSIPRAGLLNRVKEKIGDGRILSLLDKYLRQKIMEEAKTWVPMMGTPQGAVISPLLANLYLHPLDVMMAETGHKMVRYADDFVILCRSREVAESALEKVRSWTEANGLTLHPDKTHVGNCLEAGQGFEFLGYRFEVGRRGVRKKSLRSLQEKICGKTKRTRGDNLKRIIEDLNPMLKGWFGYFKHATYTIFKKIDGFIRRRLRALLRKQERRPGPGRNLSDHQRWTNAFFAEQGLFTMVSAHALASQSR